MNENPKVSNIKRHAGIAGNYSITAEVQRSDETPERIEFVGSVYGGPIVMVSPSGSQNFVSRSVTDRIGSKLTPEWVEAFFSGATS